VLKIVFWGLVALDALGIALLFLLGLAAAGSARTNPVQVTVLLLVLPSLPLLAAVLMFTRATAPVWRLMAFVLAAAPLLIAVSARALAEVRFRSSLNAAGEMTYFRRGPMRDAAEAIMRNDARTIAILLPTIDVNRAGTDGMTLLGLAMRQLRKTPQQQEILQALLAAGADPNHETQYELPLSVAIQVADSAGPDPVRFLLDARANPNHAGSLGIPVFFAATGHSAPPEVLALLIDRGADVNASGRNGQTALFSAAATRNWTAALMLLERGADWRKGRSVNGLGFRELIESYAGAEQGDSGYAAVRRFMQQH
jgi:hypothetical protein